MKLGIVIRGIGDLMSVGTLNYIAYTVSSAFGLGEAKIIALCAVIYSILRILYLIKKLNDDS